MSPTSPLLLLPLLLPLLLRCASHAAASSSDCTLAAASGNTYDLSALQRREGEDYTRVIQVGPNIQFIYRLNICGSTVSKCQGQDAPATEALRIPAGETCRVLGRINAPTKPLLQELSLPITPTNPRGAGVAITYADGDVCDPTARTSRAVTLNVECSENEPGDARITDVRKEGTCTTTFTFASRHACPLPTISSGTAFIIYLSVTAIAYFAGGAAYLYKVVSRRAPTHMIHSLTRTSVQHNARGKDLVPNREFWTELPAYVRDGVAFTVARAGEAKLWVQARWAQQQEAK
jgi:hypothetical protein